MSRIQWLMLNCVVAGASVALAFIRPPSMSGPPDFAWLQSVCAERGGEWTEGDGRWMCTAYNYQ